MQAAGRGCGAAGRGCGAVGRAGWELLSGRCWGPSLAASICALVEQVASPWPGLLSCCPVCWSLASPCISVVYTVTSGLFILLNKKYSQVTNFVGLRPQEQEAGSRSSFAAVPSVPLPLGRSPDRKLNVVFYADPHCCPPA